MPWLAVGGTAGGRVTLPPGCYGEPYGNRLRMRE
jgi:hypothetical protein